MAMEPLKSNVQEIVRAFLNDAGKYILTQGTDIADFNENFEVTKIANMIESNSMQVAIGLHPIYFEDYLQRGITEDIFENHRKR